MKKLFAAFTIVILFTAIVSNGLAQTVQQQRSETIFQSNGIPVFGKAIDAQTRCEHWHSALDIIAIKFKCCDKYYPCYSCHEETADHKAKVWPRNEFDTKAILCGVCGTELSIKDYMGCNNTCPKCASLFNPGCSKHYHLYFEVEEGSD